MWQISVTVQKTGNKFQSSQKSCRGICVKSWIDLQCDWQVSETSVLEERNFWGSRIWAPAWIECTSPVLKQSSFGCAVLLLCKFLCFTLVWANSSKMVIGLVLILLCCLLLFLYCVGKTYFKQTLYMYGNWVFWETWKLLGFFSCGFTFTFLHTMFLSGKSFAQIVTLEKTTAKSKKKKCVQRKKRDQWLLNISPEEVGCVDAVGVRVLQHLQHLLLLREPHERRAESCAFLLTRLTFQSSRI